MALFQALFEKHEELVEIFQVVFLYHAVSSAAVHTICGFAAMASFYPDLGRASLGAVIVCASIPTV
eukprot:m.79212 g.79212  ORF g.79212 m.79212 type:complete len:66 (+) comp19275_c0_seq1:292-489(+)